MANPIDLEQITRSLLKRASLKGEFLAFRIICQEFEISPSKVVEQYRAQPEAFAQLLTGVNKAHEEVGAKILSDDEMFDALDILAGLVESGSIKTKDVRTIGFERFE